MRQLGKHPDISGGGLAFHLDVAHHHAGSGPPTAPMLPAPTPADAPPPRPMPPAPTPMERPVRITTTLAAAAFAVVTLAACSSADAVDNPPASAAEPPGIVRVGAQEAVALLDERDDLTVIDVRTPAEFAEGHLEDAELVDIYEPAFRDEIDGLDRDGSYVLYCRTGNRSGQAAAFMRELGFTEVYDAGGLADLAEAGATVVR
jgi:phage shock protein E